jgi:thiamine pyrophosphokinase
MKKIALIANGEIVDSDQFRSRIRSFPYLVAIDGGINHCHRLGLRPNLIVGDFDSATKESLAAFQEVERLTVPTEKDQTDLEIALAHVERMGCEELVVFGALGKRIDHALFNINLLCRYPGILYLESALGRSFVIKDKVELSTFPGQIVSLIPLNGPVAGVRTEGLKWELSNATLDKQFMSISNVALGDKVKVARESGDLLCILLTDERDQRPSGTC